MSQPTQSPVHVLHAHSTMSMLDGASPIKDYLKYVAENNLGACSCTDHGWLTGMYDLIQGCKDWGDPKWAKKNKVSPANIKPIPGCEFYLMPLENHQFAGDPYDYFHLTVWAANMVGYKNLISLSSHSWDPGKKVTKWGKARPRITFDDLMTYGEGLIVGSGCIEGPIGKCLLKGEIQQAELHARMLKHIFGDRLFFEVFPATVDRDYHKEEIVQVTGEDGIVYSFMPEDDLETDIGTIKAKDAVRLQPREVFNTTPRRMQDGIIQDVARLNNSIIMPDEVSVNAALMGARELDFTDPQVT